MKSLHNVVRLGLALSALTVRAQSHSHSHGAPASVSALATQQIRDAERGVAPLSTTEKARARGFESVLGWIPMMGTHWFSNERMAKGKNDKLTEPSQLMFSPVNGKEMLVGAAYAYIAPLSDSTRPVIFDGNPAWHDHPDLAPTGQNLIMLHVWFVPSPDGPFAGFNPYLPYWAAGVTPPDIERMRDTIISVRVRKGALALAAVVDTAGLFPVIAKRPPVLAVLTERRAAIRTLIPKLEAARKLKTQDEWDALSVELAGHWDAMREAYLKSAVNPAVNARLAKAMDELTSARPSHH